MPTYNHAEELKMLCAIAESEEPNMRLKDPASLEARIIASVLHIQQRRVEGYKDQARIYKTIIKQYTIIRLIKKTTVTLLFVIGFVVGAAIEHYYPGSIARLWR